MTDRPIIVRSDGHYAMGGEFERLDVCDGLLRMRRRPLPVAVSYEILLPEADREGNPRTLRVTMAAGESDLECMLEGAPGEA